MSQRETIKPEVSCYISFIKKLRNCTGALLFKYHANYEYMMLQD